MFHSIVYSSCSAKIFSEERLQVDREWCVSSCRQTNNFETLIPSSSLQAIYNYDECFLKSMSLTDESCFDKRKLFDECRMFCLGVVCLMNECCLLMMKVVLMKGVVHD